jgi:carbon storage regulator
MLVLTRRLGEEIVIAGDIRITVVAIEGNRVRIGVEAPRSVAVQRRELLQKEARHGEGAARAVGSTSPSCGAAVAKLIAPASACPPSG